MRIPAPILARFLWLLALGAGFVLLLGRLSPAQAQEPTTVRCVVEGLAAEAVLVLRVENATGLFGYQVELSFDPTAVQILDSDPAQEGINLQLSAFLDPDQVPKNNAYNDQGRIAVVLTQLNPSQPQSGNGELFQARLDRTGVPSDVFVVEDLILSDKEGKELPFQIQGCRDARDDQGAATSTPTTTPTAIPTETPTPTATSVTATPSPTPTPTETPLPAASPSPSPEASPTVTPTPPQEGTLDPGQSPLASPSPTQTYTPAPPTDTPTATPSPSLTPTATPSQTPSPSPTATPPPATATPTLTPSPTSTPLVAARIPTARALEVQPIAQPAAPSSPPRDRASWPLLGWGALLGALFLGILAGLLRWTSR